MKFACFFLIFLNEVGTIDDKLTEPYFSGKFVFGQKGPKMRFLGFFSISSLFFSDFLHEVRGI